MLKLTHPSEEVLIGPQNSLNFGNMVIELSLLFLRPVNNFEPYTYKPDSNLSFPTDK